MPENFAVVPVKAPDMFTVPVEVEYVSVEVEERAFPEADQNGKLSGVPVALNVEVLIYPLGFDDK